MLILIFSYRKGYPKYSNIKIVNRQNKVSFTEDMTCQFPSKFVVACCSKSKIFHAYVINTLKNTTH